MYICVVCVRQKTNKKEGGKKEEKERKVKKREKRGKEDMINIQVDFVMLFFRVITFRRNSLRGFFALLAT